MPIKLDQNTFTNMMAAMDALYKTLPADRDNHEARKRISDVVVTSAKAGRRTYVDFENAGLIVLDEVLQSRPKRFGFGWLTSIITVPGLR